MSPRPIRRGCVNYRRATVCKEYSAPCCEERAVLQGRYGKRVPLLVKVAPDLQSEEQMTTLARELRSFEVDGVIATNTSIDHRDTRPAGGRLIGAGGLSGARCIPCRCG